MRLEMDTVIECTLTVYSGWVRACVTWHCLLVPETLHLSCTLLETIYFVSYGTRDIVLVGYGTRNIVLVGYGTTGTVLVR